MRARAAEEVILAVELDELERRARAEALLLGEVELICSGRDGSGGVSERRACRRLQFIACISAAAAVGGDATVGRRAGGRGRHRGRT